MSQEKWFQEISGIPEISWEIFSTKLKIASNPRQNKSFKTKKLHFSWNDKDATSSALSEISAWFFLYQLVRLRLRMLSLHIPKFRYTEVEEYGISFRAKIFTATAVSRGREKHPNRSWQDETRCATCDYSFTCTRLPLRSALCTNGNSRILKNARYSICLFISNSQRLLQFLAFSRIQEFFKKKNSR